MNQNKLLECMEEIKSIARSQNNRLTKEEIGRYLDGMAFDETQLEAVYRYLSGNQIAVEGYAAPTEPEPEASVNPQGSSHHAATSTTQKEKSTSKAARNLAWYRQEVSRLKTHSPQEIAALWTDFLSGNQQLRETLIHVQLSKVLDIAEKYKTRGISPDEVIAEGNVGVMMAVEHISHHASDFIREGDGDMEQIDALIEEEIRLAMENMIDATTEDSDRESTLLAKTNLLHEASKHLTTENYATPSPQELAEYTRLPLEEIYDITGLSKDAGKMTR